MNVGFALPKMPGSQMPATDAVSPPFGAGRLEKVGVSEGDKKRSLPKTADPLIFWWS